MRKKENSNHELFDAQYQSLAWAISPKNPLTKDLEAIDNLLNEVPEVLDLTHADLAKAPRKTPGGARPTEVSCEQVLRSAIVMQLRGLHCWPLAEEIDANLLYRKFTRFYGKKGSKTEFGHKCDAASRRSGLITFYRVYKGSPCHGDILVYSLKQHERLFGRVPERLTDDRRYHSRAGEEMAAEVGVAQIAFPRPGLLSAVRKSLQKTPWFRRLMRWRAGIEGNLSTLLRSFGLKRCLRRGWRSFQSHVGLGVLTYNLRLLAGHLGGA